MKSKNRSYAFLTRDSFRIEVEAPSAISAFRKARLVGDAKNKVVTNSYITFGKSGFASNDSWKTLKRKK